jgi:hypothetical protein
MGQSHEADGTQNSRTVDLSLNQDVEVLDSITNRVVWTGQVVSVSANKGFVTVKAHTVKDKRGNPLMAKFSRRGHALSASVPENRNARPIQK